jgi:hypothetical protein
MLNLFEAGDRNAIVRRLTGLQPASRRQWGKMSVAQMLAHCCVSLEVPCGDRPKTQVLLGRLFAPFVRRSALGEKPFFRNAPTDPDHVIADEREFEAEKARVLALITRFCDRGPAQVEGLVHPFFGSLTGVQWGRLMYKHLDHHLRQFNA